MYVVCAVRKVPRITRCSQSTLVRVAMLSAGHRNDAAADFQRSSPGTKPKSNITHRGQAIQHVSTYTETPVYNPITSSFQAGRSIVHSIHLSTCELQPQAPHHITALHPCESRLSAVSTSAVSPYPSIQHRKSTTLSPSTLTCLKHTSERDKTTTPSPPFKQKSPNSAA